eukprot:Gb_09997 [translate_table: standard]
MFDPKETVWRYSELVGAPNVSDFFSFLECLDLQGVKGKGTMYLKRIFDLFNECIDNRLASRESNNPQTDKKDFLDMMLDSGVDGSNDFLKFTQANIKGLFVDLFLAGSEMTATMIEWAMAAMK